MVRPFQTIAAHLAAEKGRHSDLLGRRISSNLMWASQTGAQTYQLQAQLVSGVPCITPSFPLGAAAMLLKRRMHLLPHSSVDTELIQ